MALARAFQPQSFRRRYSSSPAASGAHAPPSAPARLLLFEHRAEPWVGEHVAEGVGRAAQQAKVEGQQGVAAGEGEDEGFACTALSAETGE